MLHLAASARRQAPLHPATTTNPRTPTKDVLPCSPTRTRSLLRRLALSCSYPPPLALRSLRWQYKSTYQEENDTFKDIYILGPCAVLGILLHPNVTGTWLVNVLWAFSTYLEVCVCVFARACVARQRPVGFSTYLEVCVRRHGRKVEREKGREERWLELGRASER